MQTFFDTHSFTVAANSSYTLFSYNTFLTVLECSDAAGIDIGIGTSAKGRLFKGLSVELPQGSSFDFLKFFNDTAASISVTVILSPGRVYDNRMVLTGTDPLSTIQSELQGDTVHENWDTEKTIGVAAAVVIAANANRKGAIIQAKSTNTGIVYIGFNNTVTSSKWVVELQPGMSWAIDDYRGDLYAIASAAANLVGWGEW